MIRTTLAVFVLFATMLTGCGGGGYGMGSAATGGSSGPLSTAQLAGSAGYVAPGGFTVYFLSSDSFNISTCTVSSGCTGVWPVLVPPSAGAQMPLGWSSFVRTDGTTQLSYNGWPLYTYSGDSAAGQTNGNGINSFGGVWSIARPGMAAAVGTPSNDYNP